ncbi:MAG TPA: thioredoxin-dependent thiol peroxidase [Armatimonadota bacterium]|nr:thioredoxin-dependent thiol peroxidase [Armatimonadota bacterium]
MLNVGDPAPDFELQDADGRTVRLSDLRGRKVILYFYPRDMTPGCTQQACDFRDRFAEIQAAGVVLLGVSPDSGKSHQKFAAKYELPFPLLADDEKRAATAYGVWKEKSLYGRSYMGIERTTFLIDEQGKLARIWPKVKVAGHGEAVLAALRD